jgi:hypothetical protein
VLVHQQKPDVPLHGDEAHNPHALAVPPRLPAILVDREPLEARL